MERQTATIYHELLVLQAQAGDRQSFETLVSLWQKPFYSYALKFCGSDSAAWDIQQETWLAVVRKFATLSHPANFKSWAFAILIRKCTDHLRQNYSEASLRRKYAEHLNQFNAPSGPVGSPQEELSKLDPDQRTLLLLRFNQEMSISEIARIMQIPEGTVKSRLHRTIAELKIKIAGETQ
ncbi:MAG: RNA polymerase sigma factor [Planctomycetaceae bacterium]|nr:RNA polymerase sigma factor [Planctomycetaceae bacterium]